MKLFFCYCKFHLKIKTLLYSPSSFPTFGSAVKFPPSSLSSMRNVRNPLSPFIISSPLPLSFRPSLPQLSLHLHGSSIAFFPPTYFPFLRQVRHNLTLQSRDPSSHFGSGPPKPLRGPFRPLRGPLRPSEAPLRPPSQTTLRPSPALRPLVHGRNSICSSVRPSIDFFPSVCPSRES